MHDTFQRRVDASSTEGGASSATIPRLSDEGFGEAILGDVEASIALVSNFPPLESLVGINLTANCIAFLSSI